MMREFVDDDPLESPAEQTVPVCRRLRTKTAFGNSTGYTPWQTGSSTAAYWCLDTMSSSGPDDALVHPGCCKEGRGCFKPSE
jgi:hypothetical protein